MMICYCGVVLKSGDPRRSVRTQNGMVTLLQAALLFPQRILPARARHKAEKSAHAMKSTWASGLFFLHNVQRCSGSDHQLNNTHGFFLKQMLILRVSPYWDVAYWRWFDGATARHRLAGINTIICASKDAQEMTHVAAGYCCLTPLTPGTRPGTQDN